MNYIDMQIYDRDHDRMLEMEADTDPTSRHPSRESRQRTQTFIQELKADWKLQSTLHDAQSAYDRLYQVWKHSDSVTRDKLDPKLCQVMDRVLALKGGQ